MYQDTHLLIVLGSDLLQKVRDALPLWAGKATRLKELHNMLPRTMEYNAPCTHPARSGPSDGNTVVLESVACRFCEHKDKGECRPSPKVSCATHPCKHEHGGSCRHHVFEGPGTPDAYQQVAKLDDVEYGQIQQLEGNTHWLWLISLYAKQGCLIMPAHSHDPMLQSWVSEFLGVGVHHQG